MDDESTRPIAKMELIQRSAREQEMLCEEARPAITARDIAAMSNADIVFEHSDKSLCMLMLKNRKSGDFAVCSIDPDREVVAAPNYRASASQAARLYANPSKRGLLSLLDWTDRHTAVRRYSDLVGEVAETERVVNLVG